MLLLTIVLIPFIFGLLSWQLEQISVFAPRWVALLGVSIVLLISSILWLCQIECFNLLFSKFVIMNQPTSLWQLEYIADWIPRFGINFHLALDGLSLLMLMLSGILGFVAVLGAWNSNVDCHQRSQGLFYLNLLCLLGSGIGAVLSIDMFLFFFFWEITLIPMYFLISEWGYIEFKSKNLRVISATKFFIYAQFSGLCMLVSIVIISYFNYQMNGFWSFDYDTLLQVKLPRNIEYCFMLGFFLSFAIKMPIVPFHSWLPEVHSFSPIMGSVDLVGILLKTSIYGFFRFVLPFCPCAAQDFSLVAMLLGLLNICYGSWMACAQTDIKKIIAYANISHMGLILIAIYSNNHLSYQGAIIHMISCSVSAAGMFMISGQLYERFNTRNITEIGGLWNNINFIPVFSLCFVVAMLGIPGTGNFVGEAIILFGIFQTAPFIAIIAALVSILFSSIYSLILMQKVYYGFPSKIRGFSVNIGFREKLISIVLLMCIFLIGLFPQFILDTSYKTTQYIYMRLQKYDRT
ncbi:NADH-quinone oxidoreductase subunit M [Candidatus Blochmanniella vafra str. BVAF]|uniref:NADH-quinone oxidoreductase subunit M n=1 Tax=Blochmanniella vafra (strain BVAF) TaxID=859654 RepID=E8Q745_BLOVB|nr:NADH-quinone oxidoreductase subunit M [Candidatus Blochmannia vafer]ADV33869.1 NADH-quinone oxidoreductase subunit M [Candidatus Blochmannia vafer str. BVAF]